MKPLEVNKIYQGDVLKVLKSFPDGSVDCIVTSPPYWGLRDYGVKGQIGQEDTIQDHIKVMMKIMKECKRVLADYGTLWLNYGDTYANTHSMGNCSASAGGIQKKLLATGATGRSKPSNKVKGVSRKSMCLVHERLAIEMVDDSWVLRNKIIWHKPSVVPQSAKDRFTNDHEMIYFFSKKPKYYFEQQFEKSKTNGNDEAMRNCRSVWKISSQGVKDAHFATFPFKLIERPIIAGCPELVCTGKQSPARKVIEFEVKKDEDSWVEANDKYGNGESHSRHFDKTTAERTIKSTTLIDGCGKPVIPEIEKTFLNDVEVDRSAQSEVDWQQTGSSGKRMLGTFPTGLIPIRKPTTTATHCSCGAEFRKGIVLDPFMGSGTTAIVARALGRDYVGIELNPDYIKIAEKRLKRWTPLKVRRKLAGEKVPKKTRKTNPLIGEPDEVEVK